MGEIFIDLQKSLYFVNHFLLLRPLQLYGTLGAVVFESNEDTLARYRTFENLTSIPGLIYIKTKKMTPSDIWPGFSQLARSHAFKLDKSRQKKRKQVIYQVQRTHRITV